MILIFLFLSVILMNYILYKMQYYVVFRNGFKIISWY